MDPNETLNQIRERVALTLEFGTEYDSDMEFVQHVKALDDWLSQGGFLPEAWRTERTGE